MMFSDQITLLDIVLYLCHRLYINPVVHCVLTVCGFLFQVWDGKKEQTE